MALNINFMQVDGDGNLPSGAVTGVDSTAITDGEIVNADINASAAIALTKLAALTRGSIISGQTASNVPTALDAKGSGKILVGDGTDLASVAISGDITLAANGAVTIANDAVENAMIAAGAVGSTELAENTIQYAEVSISAADIVDTAEGKLGHANGYPLVASQGATKVVELISAILIYDYDTAAYTDGGNLTVNISGGGSALTGVISAANSVGASADKLVMFVPLAAAAANLTADTGLNLVAATAFTQPGTAAGVIRVKVAYRVHTHGLA